MDTPVWWPAAVTHLAKSGELNDTAIRRAYAVGIASNWFDEITMPLDQFRSYVRTHYTAPAPPKQMASVAAAPVKNDDDEEDALVRGMHEGFASTHAAVKEDDELPLPRRKVEDISLLDPGNSEEDAAMHTHMWQLRLAGVNMDALMPTEGDDAFDTTAATTAMEPHLAATDANKLVSWLKKKVSGGSKSKKYSNATELAKQNEINRLEKKLSELKGTSEQLAATDAGSRCMTSHGRPALFSHTRATPGAVDASETLTRAIVLSGPRPLDQASEASRRDRLAFFLAGLMRTNNLSDIATGAAANTTTTNVVPRVQFFSALRTAFDETRGVTVDVASGKFPVGTLRGAFKRDGWVADACVVDVRDAAVVRNDFFVALVQLPGADDAAWHTVALPASETSPVVGAIIAHRPGKRDYIGLILHFDARALTTMTIVDVHRDVQENTFEATEEDAAHIAEALPMHMDSAAFTSVANSSAFESVERSWLERLGLRKPKTQEHAVLMLAPSEMRNERLFAADNDSRAFNENAATLRRTLEALTTAEGKPEGILQPTAERAQVRLSSDVSSAGVKAGIQNVWSRIGGKGAIRQALPIWRVPDTPVRAVALTPEVLATLRLGALGAWVRTRSSGAREATVVSIGAKVDKGATPVHNLPQGVQMELDTALPADATASTTAVWAGVFDPREHRANTINGNVQDPVVIALVVRGDSVGPLYMLYLE